MKTLYQYERDALKILRKAHRRNGKIPITEELITDVIYALAYADNTYCEGKGLTRYKWRRQNAIFAIRSYIKKYKKDRNYIFISGHLQDGRHLSYKNHINRRYEYNEKVGKQVDFITRNAGLTDTQQKFIQMYLQHDGISNACEHMGISYKEGASLWDSAIAKFKRISDAK